MCRNVYSQAIGFTQNTDTCDTYQDLWVASEFKNGMQLFFAGESWDCPNLWRLYPQRSYETWLHLNVVTPTIKHPQVISIFVGMNHPQMVGLLLALPHFDQLEMIITLPLWYLLQYYCGIYQITHILSVSSSPLYDIYCSLCPVVNVPFRSATKPRLARRQAFSTACTVEVWV